MSLLIAFEQRLFVILVLVIKHSEFMHGWHKNHIGARTLQLQPNKHIIT